MSSTNSTQDMRAPRFLAAATAQLRRPAIQQRISSAKNMLRQTKEYVASKDYKAAYDVVSNKVKGAVGSAVEYASSVTSVAESEERGSGSGWIVKKRQSLDEWAKERRRRRAEEQRYVERVWLFPGWAVRRPTQGRTESSQFGPFTIELLVSGYCTSLRPPDQASRAQRAFMRLARSFSSLPKLPSQPSSSASDTSSLRSYTSDSNPSSMPGTPMMSPLIQSVVDEGEDIDLINLDSPLHSAPGTPRLPDMPRMTYTASPVQSPADETQHFDFDMPTPTPMSNSSFPSVTQPVPIPAPPPKAKKLSYPFPSFSVSAPTPSPPLGSTPTPTGAQRVPPPLPPKPASLSAPHMTPPSPRPRAPSSPSLQPTPTPSSLASLPQGELRTLHANLDGRLQPFWASALAGRKVRLIITLPPSSVPHYHDEEAASVIKELGAGTGAEVEVAVEEVITTAQGYFEQRIRVPFEKVVHALRSVGGDLARLQELEVRAELVPVSGIPIIPSTPASVTLSVPSAPDPATPVPSPPHPSVPAPPIPYSLAAPPPSLRLISDIDDTVKTTGVLQGARTVFHNVFVRHLDELVIEGVGEWYKAMEAKGVAFHYVSNSPFELLPVIKDFFTIAGLPHGSIKLKYYSPTTAFYGLWDSAAERKRTGVVALLDAFPDSKFILVGDTGEQDMELYVALARERTHQIVAIFLRDVTPLSWTQGSQDSTVPTEPRRLVKRSLTSSSQPSAAALSSAARSLPPSRTSSPARRSTLPAAPLSPQHTQDALPVQPPSSVSYLSPAAVAAPGPPSAAQPKAAELWRARLEVARRDVPRAVVFRLFRRPEECLEWKEVVAKYAGGEATVRGRAH